MRTGNCNLIVVNGSELLSPFVGQSEARLREVFAAARQSAPCVLLLDDVDAMAQRRGGSVRSAGGQAADRLLNQLLVETDGMDSANGRVAIVGATSRPDSIDPAFLRPGRMDQLLYIPIPATDGDRLSILKVLTRSMPLCTADGDAEVRLEEIAKEAAGFSGADMQQLCQQASELALRESIERSSDDAVCDADRVAHRHFAEALQASRRSVTVAEASRYDRLCETLKSGEAFDPSVRADASIPAPPTGPVGGMEAHLAARPGPPGADSGADSGAVPPPPLAAADRDDAMEEVSATPTAASDTGENQEVALIKASSAMVERRIAELKTKAAEDEEFVRLTASLLARREGTAAESAAREVGKIAGSVEAWTRAMAQQEQEHEHEQEADA